MAYRTGGAPRRPLLSREEESALAARMREGDAAAADRLVTSHLPFITAIANRYSRYGLPVNDLVQEGVLGLMQAISRFSAKQNVRLSSYAVWWIRAAIQAHVVRSWSLVRIGTTATQKAVFFRLRRLAAEMRAGGEPGEAWDERLRRLAARFAVPVEDLAALARRIGARDLSLNHAPASASGSDWLERLPDPAPSPEQQTLDASEFRFRRRRVSEALAALPPRERLIICRRYLAEGRISFAAIAAELGLSKERVRQLEAQAMAELRAMVDAAAAPGSVVQAGSNQ